MIHAMVQLQIESVLSGSWYKPSASYPISASIRVYLGTIRNARSPAPRRHSLITSQRIRRNCLEADPLLIAATCAFSWKQ